MARAHVLLVEDEPMILMLLAETLLEADLDVTEAANGSEALVALNERGFDLLLTDVHLPGRYTGIDVARHARTLNPKLPIVFATGRPDTLPEFGAMGEHDTCLPKPFSPSQALRAIEALLRMPAQPKL